ncbi:RNA-binding S4 domain-containing protein [Vibrio sinaloensis]|uniref:RNA-binding S4 domain-containing protein n=1 Tax=Photobacterium sp. (strain ATCC 43367) TaxID=379097 RepID=UPI0035E87A6F
MSEEYEQGEEIEIEAIGIEVSSHPIELYKVFKIANLVGGGGEAKHFIAEGYVAVNGELETRKRRKMYDGDFFEFNQEYYVVVCDAPVTEPEEKLAKVAKNTQQAKKQTKKPAKSKSSSKPAKKSASKNKPAQQGNQGRSKNGRSSIDFF